MRRYKPRLKNRFLTTLICIVIVFVSLIFLIDRQLRPIFISVTKLNSNKIASQLVQQSVSDVLSSSNYSYDSFVKLKYNEGGYVTSIESDPNIINEFKVSVGVEIANNLEILKEKGFEISIGTLSNLYFLHGKGAKLNFKISTIGAVNTSLVSKFSSAGINQTMHQIILEVNTSFVAIIPGGTTDVEFKTNYIIAETVIVGQIPDSYTYIDGESRDIISKAI